MQLKSAQMPLSLTTGRESVPLDKRSAAQTGASQLAAVPPDSFGSRCVGSLRSVNRRVNLAQGASDLSTYRPRASDPRSPTQTPTVAEMRRSHVRRAGEPQTPRWRWSADSMGWQTGSTAEGNIFITPQPSADASLPRTKVAKLEIAPPVTAQKKKKKRDRGPALAPVRSVRVPH
jgi:hypothetical protein